MGVLRAILGLAALMSGGSLVIPGKWLRGHFKHVNGSAGHDHLLCEVGSAAFGIPRGAPPGLRKGGGMYVYIGSRCGCNFRARRSSKYQCHGHATKSSRNIVSHIIAPVTFVSIIREHIQG